MEVGAGLYHLADVLNRDDSDGLDARRRARTGGLNRRAWRAMGARSDRLDRARNISAMSVGFDTLDYQWPIKWREYLRALLFRARSTSWGRAHPVSRDAWNPVGVVSLDTPVTRARSFGPTQRINDPRRLKSRSRIKSNFETWTLLGLFFTDRQHCGKGNRERSLQRWIRGEPSQHPDHAPLGRDETSRGKAQRSGRGN